MIKRSLILALTLTLGIAGAQSSVDTRLSAAPVTLEMGRYGGPLSSLLAAVAKTAGYELVLDTNVDALPTVGASATTPQSATGTAAAPQGGKPVVYSFTGKPFNQVWPLLMDVYGLSYDTVKVGEQLVLRVSSSPVQKIIKLSNANAADAVNQVKLFFGTPQYNEVQQKDAQGNVVGVTRTLMDVKLDSASLRIIADTRTNSLIIRGTNKEIAEVERLALEVDKADTLGNAESTNPVVQRVYTVKGSAPEIATLLGTQYPNLRVTPVGRTGQLVLTGPSNQLDAALALLNQVDKQIVVQSAPPRRAAHLYAQQRPGHRTEGNAGRHAEAGPGNADRRSSRYDHRDLRDHPAHASRVLGRVYRSLHHRRPAYQQPDRAGHPGTSRPDRRAGPPA